MGTDIKIIKRFSEPNQFDHAPKGTLCYVLLDSTTYDIYRQRSDDDTRPDWHHVGIRHRDDNSFHNNNGDDFSSSIKINIK